MLSSFNEKTTLFACRICWTALLPRCKMRRQDDDLNQFKFILVYMYQYTSSELSPCGAIMLRWQWFFLKSETGCPPATSHTGRQRVWCISRWHRFKDSQSTPGLPLSDTYTHTHTHFHTHTQTKWGPKVWDHYSQIILYLFLLFSFNKNKLQFSQQFNRCVQNCPNLVWKVLY